MKRSKKFSVKIVLEIFILYGLKHNQVSKLFLKDVHVILFTNYFYRITNYGVWSCFMYYGSDSKKGISSLKLFTAVQGTYFYFDESLLDMIPQKYI